MIVEYFGLFSLVCTLAIGLGLVLQSVWWHRRSALTAGQVLAWSYGLVLAALLSVAIFSQLEGPLALMVERRLVADWSLALSPLAAISAPGVGVDQVVQGRWQESLAGPTPIALVLSMLFFIGAAFFVCLDLGAALRLRRLCRRADLIRQIGNVKLCVTTECLTAFSWRSVRWRWVVLPHSYLSTTKLTSIAIAHELQHHRQGDTLLCYVDRLMLYALWWNPLCHAWVARLAELREFRCDEALADKKVAVDDYCESLISAAAGCGEATLVPSMSLARKPGSFMKRRIEEMVNRQRMPSTSSFVLPAALLAITSLFAGIAQANLDSERVLSDDAAQRLIETINVESAIDVEKNEAVMQYVRKYLGSSDGQVFLGEVLQRYEQVKPVITKYVQKYDVPKELAAVAMIESGFKNPPQSANPYHSAGMWQFIPSTARHFDLIVNDEVDERLNVDRATDAAIRYLKSLHLQFQSWPLAILSYNAGENKVRRGIEKVGTRDPWALAAKGFGGDKDYLAKFMAAVVVLHQRAAW